MSRRRIRSLVGGCRGSVVDHDMLVDLSGQAALDATNDFSFPETFGDAPFDVIDGGLVEVHPDDDRAALAWRCPAR
jgi:hypothetical protein